MSVTSAGGRGESDVGEVALNTMGNKGWREMSQTGNIFWTQKKISISCLNKSINHQYQVLKMSLQRIVKVCIYALSFVK